MLVEGVVIHHAELAMKQYISNHRVIISMIQQTFAEDNFYLAPLKDILTIQKAHVSAYVHVLIVTKSMCANLIIVSFFV